MKRASRKLLKRLLPPLLVDIFRGTESAHTWQGIYARLEDVPAPRPVFGEGLIGEMVATTNAALLQLRSGRKPYLWHEPLALVAGTVAAAVGRVRVLDFGGGVGSGFVQLLTSLPHRTSIDYLVVEMQDMCAAGKGLFAADSRIRFCTDLPKDIGGVDILYVNSVLQYIDDYAAKLRELAALDAPYFLLARLASGSCPTFATKQINVPGQILPYWFLNFGEVIGIMESAGYRLACDSLMDHAYDQSNLPESHRIERFRNALFMRGGMNSSKVA